ncbi:hypothetical protein GQ600_21070 [Phytophthora cactorum]|nr:hypothetical protein GQ600_21070 [Phytophthora cactorum]
MGDEDMDVLLVMTDTLLQQGKELREVRREVYDLLVDEAWRIAMRCRHYLTAMGRRADAGEAAGVVPYSGGGGVGAVLGSSVLLYRLVRPGESHGSVDVPVAAMSSLEVSSRLRLKPSLVPWCLLHLVFGGVFSSSLKSLIHRSFQCREE